MLPDLFRRMLRRTHTSIAPELPENPELAHTPLLDDSKSYTALDDRLRTLATMHREGTCKWVLAGAMNELYGAIDKARETILTQGLRDSDACNIHIEIRNDRRIALEELMQQNLHVYDQDAGKTRGFDTMRDIGPNGFDGIKIVLSTPTTSENIHLTYIYNFTEDWIDMAFENIGITGRYLVKTNRQDVLADIFIAIMLGKNPNAEAMQSISQRPASLSGTLVQLPPPQA